MKLQMNIYTIKKSGGDLPNWLEILWDSRVTTDNEHFKQYCLKMALSQVAITTGDDPLHKLCTILNVQCYCTHQIRDWPEDIPKPSGMLDVEEYLPGDKGPEQYINIYNSKLSRLLSLFKERLVYDLNLLYIITGQRAGVSAAARRNDLKKYKIMINMAEGPARRASRSSTTEPIQFKLGADKVNGVKISSIAQPVFKLYITVINEMIQELINIENGKNTKKQLAKLK